MDELINTVSQRFGETIDEVTADLDRFQRLGGTETGVREALAKTEHKGYGYFKSLLKSENFILMRDVEIDPAKGDLIAFLKERYETAQLNPNFDTAEKPGRNR